MSSRASTLTAIVLKRSNYREADRIVTCFTRERGKHRCIARGVRKIGSRRASFVEPLSIVKMTVHDGSGSVSTLTEISSDGMVADDIMDLSTISGQYFIAELVDHLFPDGEAHPKLFDFIKASILEIRSTPSTEIGEKLTVFTSILLSELGFIVPGKTYMSLSDAATAVEAITERKLRIRRFFRHIPGV